MLVMLGIEPLAALRSDEPPEPADSSEGIRDLNAPVSRALAERFLLPMRPSSPFAHIAR